MQHKMRIQEDVALSRAHPRNDFLRVASRASALAQDDISCLPNNKWKRTFQLDSSRLSQRDVFPPEVGDHPNAPPWLRGSRRSLRVRRILRMHASMHTRINERTLYIYASRYKEACLWRMRTLCAPGVRCLLLVRRNLDPYGSFLACPALYIPSLSAAIMLGFFYLNVKELVRV